MNLKTFRTIQGCPVYADICPYIAVCVNDARAHVNSIYRGPEAEAILHKHGKRSQEELYRMFQAGKGAPANQPGFSTHELKSDGVAYPQFPRGSSIPWWAQGFDVNDNEVYNVIAQGHKHGWFLWQPYPGGAEFHHLNFRNRPVRPKPGTPMWARFSRIRATYPRT